MKEFASIPLNADFELACYSVASRVIVQHFKPDTPQDHCRRKDALIAALINYPSGSLQWRSREVSWRITFIDKVPTLVVSVSE
jgi:hypothetical protein